MQLLGKHKAIIITSLITGIVAFGILSIQLKKASSLIAETFYEIEPKTEEEIQKELEELEALKSPTTNKAFNEDQEFKELMKNFKTVSADDFEKTIEQIENDKSNDDSESESVSNISTNKAYALTKNDNASYKKLQDLLNKKQDGVAEHASGGSTLTYSLKDRRLLSYDTPRYLCEQSGKIVVNIRVNEKGNVFEAYINGSSNTNNECLTNHAIAYAKSVRFNNASRTNQLGSITFYFKGKN